MILRLSLPSIIFVILCSASNLLAQDLLLIGNDSLNVQIIQINEDNLFYKENGSVKIVEHTEELQFVKDHFPKGKKNNTNSEFDATKQHRFRVGFQAGYSYRLAQVPENVPSEVKDYIRKLKSGYHLGVDAAVLFPKFFHFAVGIQYNLFSASSSLPGGAIFYDDTMGSVVGQVNETHFIHYIAPTVSVIFPTKRNSSHISMGLAFGYVSYLNKGTFLYDYTITSNTWGFQFEIDPDFRIYRNLYAKVRAAFFYATLNDFVYSIDGTGFTTEFKSIQGESLFRFDFSSGFRYYF